jgi:hypothetical protein
MSALLPNNASPFSDDPTSREGVFGALMSNAAILVAAPATATSAGTVGQIALDATHFYACIATNTWVRATLATF